MIRPDIVTQLITQQFLLSIILVAVSITTLSLYIHTAGYMMGKLKCKKLVQIHNYTWC